jgi:probable rRNA maturation factor
VAIEIVNRQRLVRLDKKRIAHLATATLQALLRGDSSLTIAFVRDPFIRGLNSRFRGTDRATDVLSFPSQCDEALDAGDDRAGFLGDVIISTDTASRQATTAKQAVHREIDELVIHGILHLCGYDHEVDGGEMNRMEMRLRRRLLEGGGDPGSGPRRPAAS